MKKKLEPERELKLQRPPGNKVIKNAKEGEKLLDKRSKFGIYEEAARTLTSLNQEG